jgi:Fe-S-cluster containining protein
MTDFYEVCYKCGGKCCIDAKPPITERRLRILLDSGISLEFFDFEEYTHPKVRENGYCVFFDEKEKKCLIHSIKPETCVAGPFTFDIRGRKLEIYLKKENICPLVAELKQNPEIYEEQFRVAVDNISRLVKELDRATLRAILAIDEPETDKIAEFDLRL